MNGERIRQTQMPPDSSVIDWATDFDFLDPEWTENPYPIWDARRSKCPFAHTDRFIGVYLPARYADMRAIALDTEHFSSPADSAGWARVFQASWTALRAGFIIPLASLFNSFVAGTCSLTRDQIRLQQLGLFSVGGST
jgi:hypothetical protein